MNPPSASSESSKLEFFISRTPTTATPPTTANVSINRPAIERTKNSKS